MLMGSVDMPDSPSWDAPVNSPRPEPRIARTSLTVQATPAAAVGHGQVLLGRDGHLPTNRNVNSNRHLRFRGVF